MGRVAFWGVIISLVSLQISGTASFSTSSLVCYRGSLVQRRLYKAIYTGANYNNHYRILTVRYQKIEDVGDDSTTPIEDDTNSNPTEKSLSELLRPSEAAQPNQMSGTDLAYIGDAVFELFIRSRHVWPGKRTSDLQNKVVSTVRAEHQSHLLMQIRDEFGLSEKETQVMMRGRNAVTRSKNRRNPAAYQDSTAFECLLGYMYIAEPARCQKLLLWLENRVDNQQ